MFFEVNALKNSESYQAGHIKTSSARLLELVRKIILCANTIFFTARTFYNSIWCAIQKDCQLNLEYLLIKHSIEGYNLQTQACSIPYIRKWYK